jgi:hypothetical protein
MAVIRFVSVLVTCGSRSSLYNSGDDGVRGLAPAEGPWFGVGLGDEAVDGFLERDDGVKDAALQRQAGLGAVQRLDLLGWMAPSWHRGAKMVAVEGHQRGAIRHGDCDDRP